MTENNASERFNIELNNLLSGKCSSSQASDPAAMEIAEKLVRTDFEPHGLKESLRAKLLPQKRTTPCFWEIACFFQRRAYAGAVLAAACLLVLILPAIRGKKEPVTSMMQENKAASSLVTGQKVITIPQTASVIRKENPVSAGGLVRRSSGSNGVGGLARRNLDEGGLFRSIPMADISGKTSGKKSAQTAVGQVIKLVKGRKVQFPKGSKITWETENMIFTLQTIEIRPEDFFRRKIL